MKARMRKLTRSASVALTMSLIAVAPARAIILTFDSLGVSNTDPIPPAYGDNVTSTTMLGYGYGVGAEGFTPNVTATYPNSPTTPSTWWQGIGYGDLTNVCAQGDVGGSTLVRLTLTSAAGPVELYSLDLGWWGGASTADLIIKDGTDTTLFSSNSIPLPPQYVGHTTLTLGPLVAQTLQIEATGGAGRLALDNIRFGEFVMQIPEPNALLLVGVGGLIVAQRRRRG